MTAESVVSLGAYVASGFKRVDESFEGSSVGGSWRAGSATSSSGKNHSGMGGEALESQSFNFWGKSSTLNIKTYIVSNLPALDDMKGYEHTVKRYAKT